MASATNHVREAMPYKPSASVATDPKNVAELNAYIQNSLEQMQQRFQEMSDQISSRMDEMGTRIDDIERNVAELMTQAGVEN